MLKGHVFKINPTIELVSMPNGGQEYTYSLPNNTTKFNITGTHELRIAIASGGNYITVPVAGGGWTEEIKGRSTNDITLYLTSSFVNVTARIISWQK